MHMHELYAIHFHIHAVDGDWFVVRFYLLVQPDLFMVELDIVLLVTFPADRGPTLLSQKSFVSR